MITEQTIAIKQNASNSDLQRAIEAAIPKATQQARSFANRFKGRTQEESCKKIFDYLSNNINYKADGPNQAVRLPSGLMRTGQGDCKSYSIFTSAVLTNLGIPHSLCYVSYDPKDSTPSHIYVITDKGIIIDAVYGKFNAEKQPTYKKLKKMNISLISGMNKRSASIGRSCGGAAGIMGMQMIGATQSGKDWAQSNGLMPYQSELWLSVNNGLFRKYAASKVFALAIVGRGVFRKLIEKNSGGLANSLYKLRQDSKTAKPTDPAYQKMRKIEIDFLENGGNPYELYESIDEGNKKTPTGKYFNELMKRKAAGGNVTTPQYIAGAVSALFGKKYNETTGQITGINSGIGEPATDTAAVVGSAAWWGTLISGTIGTLGTAYIIAKVGNAPNEKDPPLPPPGGDGSGGGALTAGSPLLPVLLIGGAAAAYFILSKKK